MGGRRFLERLRVHLMSSLATIVMYVKKRKDNISWVGVVLTDGRKKNAEKT